MTGSSAGFRLSNSDVRVPCAAFVRAEQLRRSPRTFAELAPDLTIKGKSLPDSVSDLRKKIDDFLSFGTRVGILINLEKECIEIRRSEADPIVLHNGDTITVPELLPGWEVKSKVSGRLNSIRSANNLALALAATNPYTRDC